ncbi:MAG: hypothetical protein QOE70_4825 [Chthoniobacter sp.]|jgi:thioredoxin-related protein|nr:hypothetical protein [Chthoniobacter sp.]
MTKSLPAAFAVLALALASSGALAAPYFRTDGVKAFADAKAAAKPIFLVFTGPTWCAPCASLEKEVFSTKEFRAYAEARFILLKVEFPEPVIEAKPADEFLYKYITPPLQLPVIVVIDSHGKKLGQTGYGEGGPNELRKELDKFVAK